MDIRPKLTAAPAEPEMGTLVCIHDNDRVIFGFIAEPFDKGKAPNLVALSGRGQLVQAYADYDPEKIACVFPDAQVVFEPTLLESAAKRTPPVGALVVDDGCAFVVLENEPRRSRLCALDDGAIVNRISNRSVWTDRWAVITPGPDGESVMLVDMAPASAAS